MTSWRSMIVFCVLFQAIALEGFSIRGWGGAGHPFGQLKGYDTTFDVPVAVGVAVGQSWFKIITFEVEAIALRQSIRRAEGQQVQAKFNGEVDSYAAFANLVLRCPLKCSLRGHEINYVPYLGGGGGASYTMAELHARGVRTLRYHEPYRAFQGFGGLSIPILPLFLIEVALNVEGRYIAFHPSMQALLAVGGITVQF